MYLKPNLQVVGKGPIKVMVILYLIKLKRTSQ